MTFKNPVILTLAVVLSMGNCQIEAREFGLEYYTEWQTNFKGGYNWVNLLKLTAELPVTQNLTFMGSTISVATTCDKALVADYQGYSNIEEASLPLTFAVLGAEMSFSKSAVFLGIRNVNEDYFTSPATSLFLNSSCGIFPTISSNYHIANYPHSSWCLHYRLDLDRLSIQSSLYDGQGRSRIFGHDNIFTISSLKDNLFSITSAEYNTNGSNYNLGCAIHFGMRDCDEDGVEETMVQIASSKKKRIGVVPWFNIEQKISRNCTLMGQGSAATSGECKYYFAIGSIVNAFGAQIGIYANTAKYTTGIENVAELTCRMSVCPHLDIQPTVEFIRSAGKFNSIALLRLELRL